ncbi:hypothetical protein Leryth_022635, partial [Lithospermum erythrorhizon]
ENIGNPAVRKGNKNCQNPNNCRPKEPANPYNRGCLPENGCRAPQNFNFAPNPKESAHPSLNSQIPVTDFLNSDPLQLHHSDHLNYVLATKLFNPNNYYH